MRFVTHRRIGSIKTFDRNLSRIMSKVHEMEITGLLDTNLNVEGLYIPLDLDIVEGHREEKKEYIWKIKQLQHMSDEQREKYHMVRRIALNLCLECRRRIRYPDGSGYCPKCSSVCKK